MDMFPNPLHGFVDFCCREKPSQVHTDIELPQTPFFVLVDNRPLASVSADDLLKCSTMLEDTVGTAAAAQP